VQRVPKSIHLRLVNRAREEGVSLNTLVIMLLSESLAIGKASGTAKNKSLIFKNKAMHK